MKGAAFLNSWYKQNAKKHCSGVVKGNFSFQALHILRVLNKLVHKQTYINLYIYIYLHKYHGPKLVSEINFHGVVPEHSQSNNV